MSGGHFQYQQYRIEDIAVEIDELIGSNDDETLDEWGQRRGRNYPPEIIEKFREAGHTLRQAAEMGQRVDWLVSGDDGEESFLRRWENEVRPQWPNPRPSGRGALTPCPFCGLTDLDTISPDMGETPAVSLHSYPGGFRVECEGCGCNGPWHPDHQAALDAWDSRHNATAQATQEGANHLPGSGCTCAASGECECGCPNVEWRNI